MKKTLLKTMGVLFVTIACLVGLNSCKDACEKDNTGSVKIYNNFVTTIVVDVWTDGTEFMGERTLSVGSSTTYENVPAGYVEIWEDDSYSDWGYWDETCTQCETLEFEIYSGKKGVANTNMWKSLDVYEKLKGERK